MKTVLQSIVIVNFYFVIFNNLNVVINLLNRTLLIFKISNYTIAKKSASIWVLPNLLIDKKSTKNIF